MNHCKYGNNQGYSGENFPHVSSQNLWSSHLTSGVWGMGHEPWASLCVCTGIDEHTYICVMLLVRCFIIGSGIVALYGIVPRRPDRQWMRNEMATEIDSARSPCGIIVELSYEMHCTTIKSNSRVLQLMEMVVHIEEWPFLCWWQVRVSESYRDIWWSRNSTDGWNVWQQ